MQTFTATRTSKMKVDSTDTIHQRLQLSFRCLGITLEGRMKSSKGEKRVSMVELNTGTRFQACLMDVSSLQAAAALLIMKEKVAALN